MGCRGRHGWRQYSSLKPLPPWICTASSPRNPALRFHALLRWRIPPRILRRLQQGFGEGLARSSQFHFFIVDPFAGTVQGAFALTKMRMAISASLFDAPKLAIGVLNCSLVSRAYSTASINGEFVSAGGSRNNLRRPMFRILKAMIWPCRPHRADFQQALCNPRKYN